MESIKIWLVQVGIKKLGPSAIRAAIAGLVALLVAHANMLKDFGIVYDDALKTVTLHLNELSVWLSVTGLGLVTAFLRAGQHQVEAIVKGTPKSGDVREEPPVSIVGGERKTDIPVETKIEEKTNEIK